MPDPEGGGGRGDGAGEAIFHLATPDQWDQAQRQGQVTPASLHTEGFIHCSTTSQVAGTIERHFADADELCLLELSHAVLSELQWDESRPGERYPHLYRPLELDEIRQVVSWHRTRPSDLVTRHPPQHLR